MDGERTDRWRERGIEGWIDERREGRTDRGIDIQR